jgi:NAD(P)H-nitrite reductase large subunit
MILQELVKNGLEVRVEVEAAAFEGNDRVQRAHLSDESEVPCDVVVIGKGVLPALDFVPRDQIEVDLGILVNQHMQTSAKDIYAAGDVAEFIDIARQRRWVNAIWPEAVAQGRIAGFNMAGRPVTYKGSLSRNVIRIFDLDILVGGVVNPDAHDEAVAIDYVDHRRRLYRKVVLRNNRLIGVVLVNAIEQGGPLISLIQNQTPILKPAENLLQPGFNVRQLLP